MCKETMRNYEQVQPYDGDLVKRVMSKLGLHVANRCSRILSNMETNQPHYLQEMKFKLEEIYLNKAHTLNDGS